MNTRTNLLTIVVFIAGIFVPATAQEGIVKAGVKALATKEGQAIKRYVYPKQAVTQLKRELAPILQNTTLRTQAEAAMRPSVSVTATASESLSLRPHQVLTGQTPYHKFLSLVSKENASYKGELAHAAKLLEQVKYLSSFPQPITLQDEESLLGQLAAIKNNHLQIQLYKELSNQDLSAMVQDLSDYFSWDKSFEEAAASYMVRYPHKRNLETLRLLHNPFIDESFKTPIKAALQKSAILPQEQAALRQALRALEQEYQRIMKTVSQNAQALVEKALSSPAIQERLKEYDVTMRQVEAFVELNGHLPKWSTRSEKERELHNRASRLANPAEAWPFEPFLSKRAEMEMLLKKYEPKRRSCQETITAYERFVEKTGRPYPRPLNNGLDVTEEESQLFDDLMYWRIHRAADTERKIREIQSMHVPPENIPFYH